MSDLYIMYILDVYALFVCILCGPNIAFTTSYKKSLKISEYEI
jgi:hypothetical protein